MDRRSDDDGCHCNMYDAIIKVNEFYTFAAAVAVEAAAAAAIACGARACGQCMIFTHNACAQVHTFIERMRPYWRRDACVVVGAGEWLDVNCNDLTISNLWPLFVLALVVPGSFIFSNIY